MVYVEHISVTHLFAKYKHRLNGTQLLNAMGLHIITEAQNNKKKELTTEKKKKKQKQNEKEKHSHTKMKNEQM